MTNFSYNDGLCNGGRTPKLWIVAKGHIHLFTGTAIAGVAAITQTSFKKRGKWSSTTYQLELAPKAVGCRMLAPLHGEVWPENDRGIAYERFMRSFGCTLSFEAFDAALLRDYPKSRERMLQGEAALESLDAAGEAELVEISTSKTSNRNPHSDVRVTAPDGRFWVVAHEAQKGTEIPGVCKVVDTKHRPGYKGGTTTLVFAIANPEITVEGEYYPKDGESDPNALGRGGQLAQVEHTAPMTTTPSNIPDDPAAMESGMNALLAKYGRK